MTEPLIIDSDETLLLARRLAERLGTTPGDAVAQALRAYDEMPAAASALLRRRPPLRDQAALVAKSLLSAPPHGPSFRRERTQTTAICTTRTAFRDDRGGHVGAARNRLR